MTIGMAIVIVAAVFFLIVSPGFRKFALAAAVIGGIGIAYLINQSNEEARQRQAQQTQAERMRTTAIRREDLSLTDIQLLRPSNYAQAGYDWVLKGTVTNNSAHALETFRLEVTITDCGGAPVQGSGTQIAVEPPST